MSILRPLVLAIGTFLTGIGVVDALAAGVAGAHDHVGHELVLAGMVSIIGTVMVDGTRPHRSNS
jgi:hypothetical protein